MAEVGTPQNEGRDKDEAATGEHPPMSERCQECLCPLCREDSRCPSCHGKGHGEWVREQLAAAGSPDEQEAAATTATASGEPTCAERDEDEAASGAALRLLGAARHLLALKDGPRDNHYAGAKEPAWGYLRSAVAECSALLSPIAAAVGEGHDEAGELPASGEPT